MKNFLFHIQETYSQCNDNDGDGLLFFDTSPTKKWGLCPISLNVTSLVMAVVDPTM